MTPQHPDHTPTNPTAAALTPGQDAVRDDDVRGAFGELATAAHRVDVAAALAQHRAQPHRPWSALRATPLQLATAVALAVVLMIGGFVAFTGDNRTGEQQVDAAADTNPDDAPAPGEGTEGTDGDPSPDDADRSALQLAGPQWTLIDGVPLVEGWPVTMTIEGDSGDHGEGQASAVAVGTAACNDYGADVTFEGQQSGTVSFRMTGQNEAGCEAPVMESEQAFLAALTGVEHYQITGDRLEMSGDSVNLVFAASADADPGDFVDIDWVLEGYGTPESIQNAQPGGYLRLGSDGALRGNTGCRSLEGRWQAGSGADIHLTSFGADGSCGQGWAEQDSFVVSVLEQFKVSVDGDQLVAESTGTEQLVFRRARPGDNLGSISEEAKGLDFDYDPALVWAVVLVADDDVLNVRSGPGVDNDMVGELAPNETGIIAGSEPVTVGGETWRRIHTTSNPEGWVNDRFLAAAPAEASAVTQAASELAALVVRWIETGQPGDLAVDGGHVYVGGIGVFADFGFPPRSVPWSQWNAVVDFTPEEMIEFDQNCPECRITPAEFVRMPAPGRPYTIEYNQDLLTDPSGNGPGARYRNGAVDDLHNMVHLTVDVPATDENITDWSRTHFFFDWATGQPELRAIYTWGWTP